MARAAVQDRQAGRQIRLDTEYWQPRLTQLLELRRQRSDIEKQVKDVESEIRDEMSVRGGAIAVVELQEIACHNLDLRETGAEESDLDLVEVADALSGCRIVTEGRVCILKLRKVKRSIHAARVDVMVSVE